VDGAIVAPGFLRHSLPSRRAGGVGQPFAAVFLAPVTTALMDDCGVRLAPVRAHDPKLTEGVEVNPRLAAQLSSEADIGIHGSRVLRTIATERQPGRFQGLSSGAHVSSERIRDGVRKSLTGSRRSTVGRGDGPAAATDNSMPRNVTRCPGKIEWPYRRPMHFADREFAWGAGRTSDKARMQYPTYDEAAVVIHG
jgi:hypothetical protein